MRDTTSRIGERSGRALFEQFRAEFQEKRDEPAAFLKLIERIVGSDEPVWTVARSASQDRPLDDDERSMIAVLVAPHLAWHSRGALHRRQGS